MPVVAEHGIRCQASDHTDGYSSGATFSVDHEVLPGFFSVHVGLARVQGFEDETVSATIGIVSFGSTTPLDSVGDPATWETAAYGTVSTWTIAWQAIHGDMTGWEFFQAWQ
jgi:hypothetical protein